METPTQYFILRKFFSVAELSIMAQATTDQIKAAHQSRGGKAIIRRAAREASRQFAHAALEQQTPDARDFYLYLSRIILNLRERDVD